MMAMNPTQSWPSIGESACHQKDVGSENYFAIMSESPYSLIHNSLTMPPPSHANDVKLTNDARDWTGHPCSIRVWEHWQQQQMRRAW